MRGDIIINNNIYYEFFKITSSDRENQKHQRSIVLWLTGISGSGKSTLANLVDIKLFELGYHCCVLDGDNLRMGINSDLGFCDKDRSENIRRVGYMASAMKNSGLITIVSVISPFTIGRNSARSLFESSDFVEIFLDASLDVAMLRDKKGLYKKNRETLISNFTGISSDYEKPINPELVLHTDTDSIEFCVNRIFDLILPLIRPNSTHV